MIGNIGKVEIRKSVRVVVDHAYIRAYHLDDGPLRGRARVIAIVEERRNEAEGRVVGARQCDGERE